jgi:hypothetical protein
MVFSNICDAAYSKEEVSWYKNTGAAYQKNSCSYSFLTSKLPVYGKFVVYQYQVHVLCFSRQGTFFAFFYGLGMCRHLSKNYNYEKNNAAAICMCCFHTYTSTKNKV